MPLNGATESVLCSKCQSPMPTSPEFWKDVIGDELLEIASFDEKEGRTSTKMMAKYGTMQMTYGRLHPRCPKCKADFDDDALVRAASKGKIHCGQCGVATAVRAPPPWLAALFPSVALLAAETVATTSAAAEAPSAQPVMIHCIQCGGKLAVDGKERLLRCQYCNGENYLPDAMWLRLHPAQTNEPWFLVFDAAKMQKTLGEDGPNGIEDLAALIGDPAGNLILAYEADEEGIAGHGSRIASLDAQGGILWVQDGIEFDHDETSLVPNPQDGTFLLVDKRQHAARVVDPRTGQPLRTIGNPSARKSDDDDDEPRAKSNLFDPYLHEGLAIDYDGTILVLKEWDDEKTLRRFFPDGSPAPLWPTKPFRLMSSRPEWGSIPACPEMLPSGASLTVGWDGFTYFYDKSHIAKATRDGRVLGVIPVQEAMIQTLHAFGVDRQGIAYLLFDHAQEIGGHAYPHVMRFLPDGRSHLWLGPHAAPGTPFLGRYTRTMCVMPDGTLLLGRDAELRRIAPTGAVLWQNALATKEDERGLADLAKKREPKKVAYDAGG